MMTPRTALAVALLLAAVCSGVVQAQAKVLKAMWGPARVGKNSAFPTYKDLSVDLYSMALDWSKIARRKPKNPADPNDPAYRWHGSVDHDMQKALATGMRVSLEITYAPAWANGGKPKQWAPKNPQDLAWFALAAARRYPRVHLWMLWGEPNRTHNFMPYDPAPARADGLLPSQARGPQTYARLLDAVYGRLKQASSLNLIIGGSTFTSGSIRAPLWIRYMRLPNGKPPRLDMYAHNPFSWREPNFMAPAQQWGMIDFSDLRRLESLVVRYLGRPYHKKRVPLFLSEWCIPTAPGDQEFHFFFSLAQQAQWITSAFRLANSPQGSFIYSIGWIHLQDRPGSSCGLIDSNNKPKPGYQAFRQN